MGSNATDQTHSYSENEGSNATYQTHRNSENERQYMREMAKSILLLVTLVATATYAAGFSPPGGVWPQETASHLPGDPIIMSAQYVRYLMFFYCNATAFASSVMVVVVIILLGQHQENPPRTIVIPLVLVALLGLLGLIGAYATGTFRDVFTAVFTSLLVATVLTYVAVEKVLLGFNVVEADIEDKHSHELLMQLATFALTVTYGSGLSTPGGFWDSTDGGNRPGDAILKGARPTVFFVCNTMAFVASLLMVLVLQLRNTLRIVVVVFAGSVVLLFCLLGSYVAGSCRETDTTIYLASLIGAILACIVFQVVASCMTRRQTWNDNLWVKLRLWGNWRGHFSRLFNSTKQDLRQELEERDYSTYVQYLATLALTITYVAGLHPPGGLWQDDGDGHKAGDPILQTTNLRRYNTFFYCNSVSFVASLVCMILVHLKPFLQHRALEQAMILDLLGLVGSYAFGSCRAETTTLYTMGIGGAAVVYVVLHVALLDNHRDTNDQSKDKDRMSYGCFVFAILVATIAYQAGLTPPGGFLLKDDESGNHAGDPVLLHNYPRRYRVFFYCNSTSFMVSIAVIILLVNPNQYRPAIRTHGLSVCTAVSFFCLLAAFAAGTTQHLKTSIYTLVLLAVVFCSAVLLILLFFLRPSISSSKRKKMQLQNYAIPPSDFEPSSRDRAVHAQTYLMTVCILVAGVTYQAGLDPPGGSWQRSSDGHDAGSPIMHNNRRQRYLLFFFSNSASFVASIFLMLSLLLKTFILGNLLPLFVDAMLLMCFLGLLGAYATGSNREWKTSVYIIAIFFSVLAYFSVLLVKSLRSVEEPQEAEESQVTVRMQDDMQ